MDQCSSARHPTSRRLLTNRPGHDLALGLGALGSGVLTRRWLGEQSHILGCSEAIRGLCGLASSGFLASHPFVRGGEKCGSARNSGADTVFPKPGAQVRFLPGAL